MSFWQTFGLQSESEIDKLLADDREETPTLQQLLEEEEIIQETKSQNKKLVAFLLKDDNLKKVINFIITPMTDEELMIEGETDGDEDEDESVLEIRKRARSQRKFRYPFVCCQMLIADVSEITDRLLEDDAALLSDVIAVFDREPPLPPLVASYVSRLLLYLVSVRSQATFAAFKNHENFVKKVASHLQCSPVTELLLRLTRTEENFFGEEAIEWLKESNFVSLLLDTFDTDNDMAHDSASAILGDIVHTASQGSGEGGLFAMVKDTESVSRLFGIALSPEKSASARGHATAVLAQLTNASAGAPNDAPIGDLPPVLRHFAENIPALVEALKSEEASGPMDTTFGTLSPPLGALRMQFIELLRAVVELKNIALSNAIVDAGLFSTSLDLFFRYVWNSMLHQSVACIITALLESGPELRLKVFTVGDLHSRISKEGLCEENTGPNRHGIMGYLTRLSVMIQSEAQTCAEIRDLLEKCEDWAKYETSDLEECKKAERAGPAVDEDELSSEEDVDDDEDNFHEDFPEEFGIVEFDDNEIDHIFDTTMYLTAGFNTDEEFESESDEEEEEGDYGSDGYYDDEDDEDE